MKMRSLTRPTSTRLVWRAAIVSHGFLQIERDARILRKVIQRAEGKHSQRRRRAGQHGRDSADRSISAAGDDGVGMLVERLSPAAEHSSQGSRELADARVEAGLAKQFLDFFAQTRDAARAARGFSTIAIIAASIVLRLRARQSKIFACFHLGRAGRLLARQPSRDPARSAGVSVAGQRRVRRHRRTSGSARSMSFC